MEAYDLKEIAAADFLPHVGEPVVIHFAQDFSLPSTILKVTELNSYTPLERGAFSVEFQTTGENRAIVQGVYRVVHPDGKYMDIFLVPIAQHHNGMRYEAVFS
ncbi:hypothetical protein LZD49_07125 [Dyadobacter sp. CY261]|uniref:DUF6916 family protein n=1 Tax=Dyadobacter sp. CY261 TaxID=2907203 RepID=UPI001F1879EF|nr:hypothetical protein [Dyadobacter sp. CY261]MCF0070238.1 hypothetical protein [Dyadobacter sp. CY261]